MRLRTRPARLLGRFAAAAFAGAITMTAFASNSNAIVLKQSYVSLQGEGAWSVAQELVPWQNELASANSSIALKYSARGSYFGRQDLATGVADFAISGLPFSADDLKTVKGGASAFISAPVQVATLATFVRPPSGPGGVYRSIKILCDPDDPSTWDAVGVTDPDGCVVRAQITSPLRIPTENLAAMYMLYPGNVSPRLNAWNNPDLLNAMNISGFELDSTLAAPDVAGRSDPDEINYYLQKFVKTAAPEVWEGNKQFFPAAKWEPITERVPNTALGATRDGAEQQLDQLASPGGGVGRGASSTILGGVAAAPPSTLRSFQSTFPQAPIMLAQMQNANGDWVAPTPDAIDKAVDAGGDTPMYALTNKVPGAFPLVWIDRLYAPAHGLSIEKTEGIAMLIRYLATTGQEKAEPVGEGRLSSNLVGEALSAADHLVVSNCVGADRHVVLSFDLGPLAPATATAMKSIGPMAHCVATPGVTPSTVATTTVPGTLPTVTTVPQSPLGSTPDTAFSNPTVIPPVTPQTPTQTNTDTPTGSTPSDGSNEVVVTKKVTGLLTATKLPLATPSGAAGGDRFATFLLGAALYLALRKPIGRLARKVAR